MLDSILADREMIVDVVKNGTMLVSARLLSGGSIKNNIWGMSTIYVLIGFIVFHIVIKKLIPSNLLGDNASMQNALKTVVKIGTMFVVSKLISGESLNMDWGKSVLYILAGYAAYDVVVRKFVDKISISNSQIKTVVDDAAQMITVAVVSRLLEGRSFDDKKWMMSVLYTIIGFAVYDVGVSNFI